MVDSGTSRTYSGGVRWIAAIHTVAMYRVLRVVVLAEGGGSFFTVTDDVHAEDRRHVAHVRHLKPVHQLLLELVGQSLAGAEEQNVVHVERQGDEASIVLVDVHSRNWLKRVEDDDGELHVHRTEPLLRVLPKTVPTFVGFYDERIPCFVVGLVA